MDGPNDAPVCARGKPEGKAGGVHAPTKPSKKPPNSYFDVTDAHGVAHNLRDDLVQVLQIVRLKLGLAGWGGGNRNGAGNDGGVTEGKVHRSAIPSSNCHNLIPSNLGALMPVVESNVALVGQLVALAAAVLLKRKTVLNHTTLAGAWLKGKG